MLVALVVLSLVVGGLSQGLRFGLQAWGRAAALIEAGDTLDAVDRTLRQMVAQMHPGQPSQPAPIVGDPARLGFVSTLPGLPPRRVEAMLLVDAQRRLVLRWRPYLNAQRLRPPDFVETELLRGVSGFALAYWQPEGGWSDRWNSADLPALIRIRLQPEGRRWPDIVVAPGLDRP
jgi:general secretion pathway protein J